MATAAATVPRRQGWSAVRYLAAASLLSLLGFLALVLVHAATGSAALLLPIQGTALLFAACAAAAAGSGILHAWSAHPRHRGAMVLIAVITLATFVAHAYVMGSPPAYTVKHASGPVGTTFSDGTVNVTSAVTGDYLTVTVTSGANYDTSGIQCCVIADPVLGNSSGDLRGKGFPSPPTLASPLGPSETTVGTYLLSKPVSTLNITYDSLVCYSMVHNEYGCIMDEVYYVPEGMGILAGEHCSTSGNAPSSCHMEHPALSPALIAAGMAVLGEYNSAGWRLFPALLGTLSVPLLFGIAWKLSGDKKIALIAALLLSLDVMFFAQSGAAVLDVPQVFFGLAAFMAYLSGVRWWKFDKYVVSGVLLGLAGLAKETAIFLVLAFLTYVVLSEKGPGRKKALAVAKVVLVVGVVFAVGLQAYDSTLAPAVPSFVGQVRYILSYGSGLDAGCPWACGWTNSALGGYITPLEWLLYFTPVGYYVTSVSTCSGGACSSYVGVGYYGVTNLLETWTVFVWVPLIAFELFKYRRSRKTPPAEAADPSTEALPAGPGMPGDLRLGAFALLFLGWTYLPYIPLFLAGRVTYPFYFVPAIPAVALGASWWTTREYFPRGLLAVYLAMVFLFFLVYFPDKSFLPVWLRVLLRH